MVIYELGIVNNGVLLVSKEYYKELNIIFDPSLRAGFFTAINYIATELFSDTIESFDLQNFKIIFLSRTYNAPNESDIIAYGIGDKRVNLKLAKDALTRILDAFFQKYNYSEINSGNLNIYCEFEQIMDGILGDLVKNYADRLKSIFG